MWFKGNDKEWHWAFSQETVWHQRVHYKDNKLIFDYSTELKGNMGFCLKSFRPDQIIDESENKPKSNICRKCNEVRVGQ